MRVSPVTVGVSLKAYFDRDRARRWFDVVAAEVGAHPAVRAGAVEVFVAPTYLQIDDAVRAFRDTPIAVAAQDVSAHGDGAFTGEVSAAELTRSGVTLAEIGHAERRRLYRETDADVAEKVAAALAAGVVPVLCLGESAREDAAAAAAATLAQLRAATDSAPAGRLVVAYEPVWAIGADAPAPVAHVAAVTRALRVALDADAARAGSAVVYGGSAGPGLLARLGDAVDGLFLGRFAHDPAAFRAVVDEAARMPGLAP